MAEPSPKQPTGILALAQKQLARTKTKVLQNLGKAEKTTDDVFNDIVLRIEKQQEVGHHLQKELRMYAQCLREMSQASKNLTTALEETYEPEWTKEPTFKSQLQAFDLLWNDLLQTQQDSVVVPLTNYLNSFPAVKAKIAKRGRKMVDYDNSRHNLEVLQTAKKKDEVKIQKAQEEMKEARRIYDELNNELHTELPEFINSRVTFYANLLSSLFSSEVVFHSELAKVNSTMNDICQDLSKEADQFKYQPIRPLTESLNAGENGVSEETSGSAATTPSTELSKEVPGSAVKTEETKPPSPTASDKDQSAQANQDANSKADSSGDEEANDEEKIQEETNYWKTPTNEPVICPPPNTLFKVMVTHSYTSEDLDELNLEVGEVVYAIPYENAEDQDEGWQMGMKASDGIQGVFPLNFTQRI